jgi:hypothetical protein
VAFFVRVLPAFLFVVEAVFALVMSHFPVLLMVQFTIPTLYAVD